VAATMVCGKHHGQAMVAAAQLCLLFPKRGVLGRALNRGFCLASIVLGQLGLICLLS